MHEKLKRMLYEAARYAEHECNKYKDCHGCPFPAGKGCGKAHEANYLLLCGIAPVVYCEDCTFCKYNTSSMTYYCTSQKGLHREVKPDDFCSYGERNLIPRPTPKKGESDNG